MRFTDDQKFAQLRIHELLAELVDIIGPRGEGAADYDPGDEPAGDLTLAEYVVVCCWVDEKGEDFPIAVPGAAGMLPHHVGGLLATGARIYD